MKRPQMQRSAPLLALACAASVVHANGSFYVGAGVTSNHASTSNHQGYPGPSTDLNNNSWQFFAGYRPVRLFAIEADYIDMGSKTATQSTPMECADMIYCGFSTKSDAKALAGYAVGFLPIPVPFLDVYGKLGLASYKLNTHTTTYYFNGSQSTSASTDNGTSFTWGAGVQAHAGMFGARLEYEGFDKASTSVFSLGLFVTF